MEDDTSVTVFLQIRETNTVALCENHVTPEID